MPKDQVSPNLDGRYELSVELGRGATGTVWQAFDRTTSSIVAVKLLDSHVLGSKHAKKRFAREVATASALQHPHVVEVRAHGVTPAGGAYLVMERLLGETLAARLREAGPLPQPRAIKIIAQVLDAVLAAHRMGVVHRDLKPSNVMLIERGGDSDFVKVCDFGLAKDIERDSYDPAQEGALAVDLRSVSTEHGQICGTPEYMAPEQALGETIDERADLYAVAAMLFHAVVGRPPFSARSPLGVVSLHLSQAPPRPSELRPDLGIFPPLESLILRGLAKDRAERPSSAAVFRADLLRIERDYARWAGKRALRLSFSAPADPVTLRLAPEPASPSRRSPWLALLTAGIVAGGVVTTAWWPSRKTTASASSAPSARPPQPPPSSAPASEPAGARKPVEPVTVPALVAPPAAPRRAPNSASRSRLQVPSVEVAPRATPLDQATAALAEGRLAEACSLGEIAAAQPGASPAVWKFLGQCFMRLGQREKGIAYYERYLAAAPSSPDALFVREMIR